MSIRNSGRVRLAGIAASTCAFDRIGVGDPVRGDDDVGLEQRLRQACPTAATVPPTSSASSCACASVRLVITSARDALRLEVDRRELAHLAGADDEHAAAVQVAEDLLARG